MSLRILSHAPKHWRNGTSWIGRTACKFIGEDNYDQIRVFKRTVYAEWWYMKQHFFYWAYVNKSEWANFFALLPKPDSSHGFPYKETPSRYAQLAEDNFSSDGYISWYTYAAVAAASVWSAYIYFWPRRWVNAYDMLSEENEFRLQYVDSFSIANLDQTMVFWGNFWSWLLPPHKFHWFRNERASHFLPDSKIRAITITLNKKNSSYEHYWRGVGFEEEMI